MTETNILRLVKLKKQGLDTKDPARRIEFASIVHQEGLYHDVSAHSLLDSHGISGRDLDACFEMGDGEEVVYGIMDKAKTDPQLLNTLGRDLGGSCLASWTATYQALHAEKNSQRSLF